MKRRRLGFDLDGVIVNFARAYEDLIVEQAGVDLFPEHRPDPPVWNWPEFYGYTHEQTKDAWKVIDTHPFFWSRLKPLPAVRHLRALEEDHDLYFITHRQRGVRVKQQTEGWLHTYGVKHPTVLLADGDGKGPIARGLKLHFYIDDKLENAVEVAEHHPGCQVYLLDYPHNQGEGPFTRVLSVSEALKRSQLEGAYV